MRCGCDVRCVVRDVGCVGGGRGGLVWLVWCYRSVSPYNVLYIM